MLISASIHSMSNLNESPGVRGACSEIPMLSGGLRSEKAKVPLGGSRVFIGGVEGDNLGFTGKTLEHPLGSISNAA
jgi:hypothetical protein